MKALLILAAVFLAACTHGPEEDHVIVQNLALKPDATRLAVIVKYERTRQATGLAAFPDGGVPLTLEQRADVYVIDLRSRAELFRVELPAPKDRRLSFEPWLAGWAGDQVYFQVTGCAGSPGSECYGLLVGKTMFRISPTGQVTPAVAPPASLVLMNSVRTTSQSLSFGVGPSGVSTSTQMGAPRQPLLRFKGVRLVAVAQ